MEQNHWWLSPTVWLLLTFALLPALVWFADHEASTWRARLWLPQFIEEPSRHTPRHSQGTFLPPELTADLTLTAADNPILLTHTTRVPAGLRLTLQPGVSIFAHEFATLVIDGQLESQGTKAQPVHAVSNEMNPANRVWGGIIFQAGSTGSLDYTIINAGSPAISCLAGSTVNVAHARFEAGSVGVYAATPACRLSDSTIYGSRDGVVAVNVEPALSAVVMRVTRDMIRRVPVAESNW